MLFVVCYCDYCLFGTIIDFGVCFLLSVWVGGVVWHCFCCVYLGAFVSLDRCVWGWLPSV